jgi:hypothetical protein
MVYPVALAENVIEVLPGNAVPDLEPGVLNAGGETVIRAGPAEGKQKSAGLQYAQRLASPLLMSVLRLAGRDGVPRLAHERQVIRRVCHDGVHGCFR